MNNSKITTVSRMRELMITCLEGMADRMHANDMLNIGNSMAFDLAEYEEYSEVASGLLEGDDNPINFCDAVFNSMISAVETDTYGILGTVERLPMIARDEALRVSVVPYARRVLGVVRDDDDTTMLGLVSAFTSMYELTIGVGLMDMPCHKEIAELISMVDDGWAVDMMGDDIDTPPESFDRGRSTVIDNKDYERSISFNEDGRPASFGADMSIAKSILTRLSLKNEDREKLLEMADEVIDGVPKYTTTDLVNMANEIIGEYE